MKIIGTIEKSKDNLYSIYPDKAVANFAPFGYGLSIDEARKDFMVGIEEFKELKKEELGYVPKEFDRLIVEFRYDVSTLFEELDFLNISRFAKYAGINESKMRQYTSGVCTPGVKASEKISKALKTIGEIIIKSSMVPLELIEKDLQSHSSRA